MRATLLAALFAGACASAHAQAPSEAVRGDWPIPTDGPLSEAERADIQARLQAATDSLQRAGVIPASPDRSAIVAFSWPMAWMPGFSENGYHGISNFVDHNPAANALRDYQGNTRTYDGHRGTDFFTWPFGWQKMDRGEVQVVAAAPGVIIARNDGQFDRSCVMNGNVWNAVYVRHADGSVAWYGHLKNGSVTPLQVGDAVAAGDYLGIVGSSGNSTGPHLHMEVYNDQNVLIDPWVGPSNPTTSVSWWAAQRPYRDSAINAARTHSAAPVFPTCPTTVEQTNEQDAFSRGSTVYLVAYYRDQMAGHRSTLTVRRPDGTPHESWTHDSPSTYEASYWYWTVPLPADAPQGTWSWEVTYQGHTEVHPFSVGTVDAEDGPDAHRASLVVAPNPVQGQAEVRLQLAAAGRVAVDVLDPLGRRVARLHDGPLAAGIATFRLDAAALPAGAYLVRAVGDGFSTTQRITLAR